MKTYHYLWQMIRYRPVLYAINAFLWLLIHLTPLIPGLIAQQFFNRLPQIGHLDTELWLLAALLVATTLARVVLKERVDSRRWVGACLVACGVALLAQ